MIGRVSLSESLSESLNVSLSDVFLSLSVSPPSPSPSPTRKTPCQAGHGLAEALPERLGAYLAFPPWPAALFRGRGRERGGIARGPELARRARAPGRPGGGADRPAHRLPGLRWEGSVPIRRPARPRRVLLQRLRGRRRIRSAATGARLELSRGKGCGARDGRDFGSDAPERSGQVTLELDVREIFETLGSRALFNRSRKAVAMSGMIRAHAQDVRTHETTEAYR